MSFLSSDTDRATRHLELAIPRLVATGKMTVDVCCIEVVSLEEKGFIERTCERIRKAVTEVQSGRVLPFPYARKTDLSATDQSLFVPSVEKKIRLISGGCTRVRL
jgi:hypothetical protein